MKIKKDFIYLLFSLVCGFILGLNIKVIYEKSFFRAVTWSKPPIVVNCYGKDFDKAKFEKAIEYWREKGDEVLMYVHSPSSNMCEERFLSGFIFLRKKSLDHPTLAKTTKKTSFFKIISATIYYSPGSFRLDLINEHELGHAFGYSHAEEEGHIMYPTYNKMGSDFWIP